MEYQKMHYDKKLYIAFLVYFGDLSSYLIMLMMEMLIAILNLLTKLAQRLQSSYGKYWRHACDWF